MIDEAAPIFTPVEADTSLLCRFTSAAKRNDTRSTLDTRTVPPTLVPVTEQVVDVGLAPSADTSANAVEEHDAPPFIQARAAAMAAVSTPFCRRTRPAHTRPASTTRASIRHKGTSEIAVITATLPRSSPARAIRRVMWNTCTSMSRGG